MRGDGCAQEWFSIRPPLNLPEVRQDYTPNYRTTSSVDRCHTSLVVCWICRYIRPTTKGSIRGSPKVIDRHSRLSLKRMMINGVLLKRTTSGHCVLRGMAMQCDPVEMALCHRGRSKGEGSTRGSQEFKNYPGLIFFIKALATPPPPPTFQTRYVFIQKWYVFPTLLLKKFPAVLLVGP